MLGCDQYQGYHYSAAMPASELAELFRDGGRPQDSAAAKESDQTRRARSLRRPG
jgi:predicted signal transduction protein with EAL and GGDEF domain